MAALVIGVGTALMGSTAAELAAGQREGAGASGTHYVSPQGSDAGPGTRGRPWRTLAAAARLARPGDVVVLKDGRYLETRPTVVPDSGVAGPGVVFRAEHARRATIDYIGLASSWKLQVFADGVVIQDLVITQPHRGDPASDSLVRVWRGADDVRLVGNDIHGAHTALKTYGTRRLKLLHNRVHDTAIALSGFNAAAAEVAHNEIYDFERVGIIFKGGSRDLHVHENVIIDAAGRSATAGITLGGISCGSRDRLTCGNADPRGYELDGAEVKDNLLIATASGTGTGIALLGCRGCHLSANRIKGFGTGLTSATNDGLAHGWNRDVANTELRLTDNVIEQCRVIGARLAGLEDPPLSSGNTVSGCPPGFPLS